MKNYIGITGFKKKNEIKEVSAMFEKHRLPDDYTIMLGILSSHKLFLKPDKEGTRFPTTNSIPGLVKAAPEWSLPMIHYQTYDQGAMVDDMTDLFDKIYDDCQAIQLNMYWPDVKDIRTLKERFPNMQILIPSIGSSARKQSPTQIANQVAEYGESISHFLYDPSGGAGAEFDVQKGIETMLAVKKKSPHIKAGVAGGFDGDNVYGRITQIFEKVGDFFIDAEGKLMPSGPLEMNRVDKYISEAVRAYKDAKESKL